MSRALWINAATSSRSTSITCGEGQQNGAGDAPSLRLLLLGWLRRLSCLFICCRFAGLIAAEVHFIYRGNVTAQA